MATINQLIHETSPYLLQHAHNPVNWYPWNPASLKKAREENKPIFLSIGYSACHWCHVMAHESFMDLTTAQVMNELFINIKVDREERPDLDKIYQTTHQMLTQRAGGWPLSVFLDPHKHLPFFSGTYFPKEPRYQLPAFKDLLQKTATFYHQHQQELLSQAPSLLAALQNLNSSVSHSDSVLDERPWQFVVDKLANEYDFQHGGFGSAPKFLNPSTLELVIRKQYFIDQNEADKAQVMAQTTLINMAQGGIYDQIGGGFYRYAVDAAWQIPHFEKMLYDNAQLLFQYAQADGLKSQSLFKKIIQQTANWIMTEMQSAEGGYYSAIDADAAGKEGGFYVWNPEQIQQIVSDSEYALLKLYFNLLEKTNFKDSWHLHISNPIEKIAEKTAQSRAQISLQIDSAREKLWQARNKRVKPMRDEKILTAWNALAIKGMVLAGVRLQQPALVASAERALKFIYQQLWKNGRLLAVYKDGQARLPAYLDDYAFLLDAILVFLQYQWRTDYVHFAQALANALLDHFEDKANGGFFFVADDHESLIYKPKSLADGVMPAGNGVACYCLQRLGYLLAEPRYLQAVKKTLQAAWPYLTAQPGIYPTLLFSLKEYFQPPQIIIVRGKSTARQRWQQVFNNNYSPWRMVLGIDDDERGLPAAIEAKPAPLNRPIAYLCQGQYCSPPISNLRELKKIAQQRLLY